MKMPSIKAVAKWLADIKRDIVYSGEVDANGCDVRLQVREHEEGGMAWAVHFGSSDYDQDHRGFWGASSLDRRSNCRAVARDLIEQAAEHAAQCEGV